jgi:hypothetical protein
VAREAGARFQQGQTPHPAAINRLIDCPYATHLARVRGSWEDWAREKKNTVRNRDTDPDIYINVRYSEKNKQKTGTLRQAKSKIKCANRLKASA